MLDQVGTERTEYPEAPVSPGDAVLAGRTDTHGHPHDHESPYAQPVGAPQGYYPDGYYYGWQPPPPPGRAYRFLQALWTRPSWLAPLAVLGCIVSACTYVLSNNPSDHHPDPLGPCAFKTLTGLDCPGCGGTRMVWYLLHGNVLEAARYHVMALIAVPVLIWAYIVWSAKRLFNVKLPSKRIPTIVIASYLAAWVVFSVLRDLPWPPFHWLRVS